MVSTTIYFWAFALGAGVASAAQEEKQVPIESPAAGRCSALSKPAVPGAEVVSIVGTEKRNVTFPAQGFLRTPTSAIDFCDVSVTLTHPGANDTVLISVWLPLNGWNGRFQGTGGGGLAMGAFAMQLAPAVEQGYSAASTDGGHILDYVDPSSWALRDDGTVNIELLRNFASRSLHDLAVVGKAVTADFYGVEPKKSYWNGCSTGGRQGHMLAQRYPTDFDGILANAPAIHFTSLLSAELWPQVVMQELSTFPTKCELDHFVTAALAECDLLDGVKDGVVNDPFACNFDPQSLVGSTITCEDGESITINERTAEIVRKTTDGPTTPLGHRLWHGLPISTPLHELAGTKATDQGRTQDPFPISSNWFKYFVLKKPDFDLAAITPSDYAWLFSQNSLEYGWMIDTDSPDLSAFRDAGGKLLTWHGTVDQLIPVGATVEYRERVEGEMGGAKAVDEFYRLFLAPGVAHCWGGAGPIPSDPLSALVAWVEEGKPPATIHAAVTDVNGTTVTSRNLCRYPYKLRYLGSGDANLEQSWTCDYDDDSNVVQESKGSFTDTLRGLFGGW